MYRDLERLQRLVTQNDTRQRRTAPHSFWEVRKRGCCCVDDRHSQQVFGRLLLAQVSIMPVSVVTGPVTNSLLTVVPVMFD